MAAPHGRSSISHVLPLIAAVMKRIGPCDSHRTGPYINDDDLALAIVGSRHLHTPAVAEQLARAVDVIARLHAKPTVIVSGGAGGVDYLAAEYARAHKMELVVHRPLNVDNKGDYLRRNGAIVRDARIVLAMPAADSRGTWDTVRKALERGRTTYVIAAEPPTAELIGIGFVRGVAPTPWAIDARLIADGLYELHYDDTS